MDEIKKQYYSIGEVSKLLEIQPSVLRFWETEFKQIQPRKNRKGNRTYTPEAIEVLATPCDHAASEEHLDMFGMTGPVWLPVALRLTARAYRLLVEEHAAARSYVLPDPVPASDLGYRFRGEVRSYLGIGRFVLGLPTEIEVVEPTTFRAFLREKAGRARW